MREKEQQKFAGLVITGLIVFYLVIQIARTLLPWAILLALLLTIVLIYDQFTGYRSSETLFWVWGGSILLVFLLWFIGYGITGTETGEEIYIMGESFHNLSSEFTDAQLEMVDAAEESTTSVHNETNTTSSTGEPTKRAFGLLRLWIRIEGLIPSFP